LEKRESPNNPETGKSDLEDSLEENESEVHDSDV
jgi:hypothetical protein